MALTQQAPMIATVLLLAVAAVHGSGCPYASGAAAGDLAPVRKLLDMAPVQHEWHVKAGAHKQAGDADFAAVRADLTFLLTDSQPFWPADGGNYGGFFVRLAWHCSGSYRSTLLLQAQPPLSMRSDI